MATVYERFKKLGLARSNAVLQLVGEHVSKRYHNETFARPNRIVQTEDDGVEYTVNDYPSSFTDRLDKIILSFIKAK